MSELDSFRFQKPNDFRSFRSGLRNIVEYSLGDRLTAVKLALMDLFPEIGRWESEERAKRSDGGQLLMAMQVFLRSDLRGGLPDVSAGISG